MKSNRSIMLVVVAVIVVIGIGLIAFVAGGGDDDQGATASGVEESAEPVDVSGSALVPFPGADDPAVGEPFPTLSGTGLDGRALTFDPEDGPTVVVVLAHWCPHCQRELPLLVERIAAGDVPEGVRVVGVTTSFEPSRGNYPPSAWLAGEGWDQPTLLDPDESAAIALGVTVFPFFVAVDGDGNVAARTSGELSAEEFQTLLESVSSPR